MTKAVPSFFIGTAAWTIPQHCKPFFAAEGTHLERYAGVFNGVEINSSFYKDHKPETYAKWAAATPQAFRFSVKLQRYFTHEKRLNEAGPRLGQTLRDISSLGKKWGVLLVQLPPSLAFKAEVVSRFVNDLKSIYAGPVAWEPRHESWASDEATDLLSKHEITYVTADPDACTLPPGSRARWSHGLRYYRLHGTPEIYKSRYSEETLTRLAEDLIAKPHVSRPHVNRASQEAQEAAWVIFDNTTYGYATENALELQKMLSESARHTTAFKPPEGLGPYSAAP